MRRPPLLPGLFLVVLGGGAWGFWIEPASLVVREHRLEVPGWPEGAPLRIALLSDLHVGSPFNGPAKLRDIVRRTNDARPQIVLLAGDFVIHRVLFGDFVPPEAAAKTLRDLRAPLGVHAVLGNHDYALSRVRVREALDLAGIRVLEDEAVRIEADPGPGGGPPGEAPPPFWLVGVSDFVRGPHDLARALAMVSGPSPVILFTHNPDLFPEVPERVGLTLAGHTHGGQVYVPLLGRPIVPSKYGSRYAAGLVIEHGRRLFVTTGLGTSIVPVRFLVPPEISLLTVAAPSGS